MFRVHLLRALVLVSFLAAPASAIQPGPDSIGVNVTSPNYSFVDQYQFQAPASGQVGVPSGVLKTGGISSTATVARTISKQVPYTELVTVYRIVNGRLVAEQQAVTKYRTVSETVYQQVPVDLPAANGTWYALNGPAYAVWIISSVSPAGIVVGVGTRQAGEVHGVLTIVSLPNSPIPTGTYHVDSAAVEE